MFFMDASIPELILLQKAWLNDRLRFCAKLGKHSEADFWLDAAAVKLTR